MRKKQNCGGKEKEEEEEEEECVKKVRKEEKMGTGGGGGGVVGVREENAYKLLIKKAMTRRCITGSIHAGSFKKGGSLQKDFHHIISINENFLHVLYLFIVQNIKKESLFTYVIKHKFRKYVKPY